MYALVVFALLVANAHTQVLKRTVYHASFLDLGTAAFPSGNSSQIVRSFEGTLFRRQREKCSLPGPTVNCPDGETCCPAETPQCCGDGTCCQTGTNCLGAAKCCPSTAVTCGRKDVCAPVGSTCCGQTVCPSSLICSTGVGGAQTCCPSGSYACDSTSCCPEGTTCGADNSCETLVTRPSTSTRTTSKTSTSVAAITSYSTKTYTTTYTTTSCPPSSKASKRSAEPTSPSKRPTADDPGTFLVIDEECHPMMEFPCVEGLTDELCNSMCAGIADTAARGKGELIDPRTMILTWAKKAIKDPKCTGFCVDVTHPTGARLECDEFPPKSFAEGGPGSHKMCIDWEQNSKTQGPLIRQYRRFYNVQPGQKVVIQMGECPELGARGLVGGTARRQSGGSDGLPLMNGLSTTETGWVVNPNVGHLASAGWTYTPLGNATPGLYRLKMTFADLQGVRDLAVIDSGGVEYWSQSAPFDQKELDVSITVDDNADPLGMIAPAQKSVSLSASVSATMTASLPGATSKSFGTRLGVRTWDEPIVMLGLLAVVLCVSL